MVWISFVNKLQDNRHSSVLDNKDSGFWWFDNDTVSVESFKLFTFSDRNLPFLFALSPSSLPSTLNDELTPSTSSSWFILFFFFDKGFWFWYTNDSCVVFLITSGLGNVEISGVLK